MSDPVKREEARVESQIASRTIFVPQRNGAVSSVTISGGSQTYNQRRNGRSREEINGSLSMLFSSKSGPAQKQFAMQFVPEDDLPECNRIKANATLFRSLQVIFPAKSRSRLMCLGKIARERDVIDNASKGDARARYILELSKINKNSVCDYRRDDVFISLSSRDFVAPLVTAGNISLYCGNKGRAIDLYNKAFDYGAIYAGKLADLAINQ